jgi:AcrR family transcriptional regulator
MLQSSPRETNQKRIEIADAALRVIGSRGIAGLSTAALAEELCVSSGAPFRHFKSREAILEAVAQRVAERIETTFPDPGLPPLERLEKLFRARAEMLGRESGIARLIFSDQFTKALPPPAVDQIHHVVKQTRAFVLKALKEAAEAGLIRGDIPPEDLLVPVVGTLQHLGFLTALPADGRDFKRPDPSRIVETLFALLKK